MNLGGGRGKSTAVARLELDEAGGELRVAEARLRHGHRGSGEDREAGGDSLFRDEALVAYLERWVDDETAVAINAPLTLPPCIRCTLPCPGVGRCEVPVVAWMRRHADGLVRPGRSDPGKPSVTPYTQRAVDLLFMRAGLKPRESLGQGMGPLSARAVYLRRVLSPRLRLHENLIEVHPPATVIRLFGEAVEHRLRRADTATIWELRKQILAELPCGQDPARGLGFRYVWPEVVVRSPHVFDAILCAHMVFLWAADSLRGPAELHDGRDAGVDAAIDALELLWLEDGWIWIPRAPTPSAT
ncbi:MAG: DUF429 domain-containing protein [Myxococcales bacterium]|nr:DUF429 domain-containing protein [Myxococcales bacterium]